MATKDIRDRLYTILSGMTAVTGTVYTVAPRIPRGAADYEGYIIQIRMTQSTPQGVSAEIIRETQAWQIELISPPLGIGFDGVREDAMYGYRDLVLDTLLQYPRLESSGVGLTGVNGVTIGADRFQTPYQWANTDRALWAITLSINYQRVRSC